MDSRDNEGMKSTSFASMFKDNTSKKTVHLSELRNDECVSGADVSVRMACVDEVSGRFANTLYGYFIGKRLVFPIVENYDKNTWAKYGVERIMSSNGFFFFQFATKEGMEQVLENGPWLIRRIDLNYCQVRSSIMLDAYTSTMCLNSWGRNTYARALIGVSSTSDLVKSLIVDIPFQNGPGHSLETIDIEYEWKPPRCYTCKILDHMDEHCPKKPKTTTTTPTPVTDDGFVKETRKGKGKHASKPRHINGETVHKNTQPTANKVSSKSDDINIISFKNSFDALKDQDDVFETDKSDWQKSNNSESTVNDGDSEEVKNVFVRDNGKPIDGLVNDAQKKVKASPRKIPRKTGIWSG
uniref:DUF4283 domain-containing protein n=1 Tax=Tanacetum cinerariifolium TaxID=118510 RepID=A0A699H0L8_TANCI|nr:hypothetical protein [Tanacetum cinerariifolium]